MYYKSIDLINQRTVLNKRTFY